MIRKNKSTDLATKASERLPTRTADLAGPLSWFEEMDRWFDSFRRDFEDRFWGPIRPWSGEVAQTVRAPLTDLLDEGREFVVKAELPGVSKEDLDIRVTPEAIEVRAETERNREEKEKDYYYRERSYRTFQRVLPFPEEVLPDQAEAKLKDGLLEVRVPKKEPTPKREPVKVRVE